MFLLKLLVWRCKWNNLDLVEVEIFNIIDFWLHTNLISFQTLIGTFVRFQIFFWKAENVPFLYKNSQSNSKGQNLDNVHVKLNYLCFLVRETSSQVLSGLQGKLSPSVCWMMFAAHSLWIFMKVAKALRWYIFARLSLSLTRRASLTADRQTGGRDRLTGSELKKEWETNYRRMFWPSNINKRRCERAVHRQTNSCPPDDLRCQSDRKLTDRWSVSHEDPWEFLDGLPTRCTLSFICFVCTYLLIKMSLISNISHQVCSNPDYVVYTILFTYNNCLLFLF